MPVISMGKIEFLYPDNADLLAYRRYDGETELLVLCNLREREIAKPLPVGWTDAEKLLGNYPDTADTLRPYECVVLKRSTPPVSLLRLVISTVLIPKPRLPNTPALSGTGASLATSRPNTPE